MKNGSFLVATFAACTALFLCESTPLVAQTADLAAKSDQELVNEIAVLRKRIRRLELEREAALLRERSHQLDAKRGPAGEQSNVGGFVTAANHSPTDAYAADLPVKASPVPPVPVRQRWDGFYVGANVGYGFSNDSAQLTGTDSLALPALAGVGAGPVSLNLHPGGVVGGGQVGFNSQMGNFVWGIEADAQASGVKGSALTTGVLAATTRASEDLDWFGTFRGRIGFTPVNHILVYGTGGVAFGQVKTSVEYTITSLAVPPTTIDLQGPQDEKRFGWVAGGGVEYAFNSSWSARFDYLYADLGKTSLFLSNTPGSPGQLAGLFATYDVRHRYNFARFGVNYRFAGPY